MTVIKAISAVVIITIAACGSEPTPSTIPTTHPVPSSSSTPLASPLAPTSPIPTPAIAQHHDSILQPYMKDFEHDYGMSTDSIAAYYYLDKTKFDETAIAGYCDGIFTININPVLWVLQTENIKRVLVYHELGHCLLRRQHRNDMYSDGCSKSIMSAILMDETCFKNHEYDLLMELIEFKG